MDVFNFKCKYCGGELNSVDGLKSVGKCKYCGSKQTLPKLENEKRANLFERANHLRRNNEFDKAEALYEQLLNEDLSDPEAYWSLVLCRYGIEYVEDKRSGERLPTVNRMQMTSILGDEDYKSAIANADSEQKSLYEEEAKLINEIQKGILEIARKEEPFDIFICYKETDAEGKRSRDSILAQDLYHELTRDGYKVFFARVTLQGKLGSAYEPYIFSALNSAKVMVVLGTKKEHFEAVWVRNEWSRFLGQIKKGERKVLIPAYRDMDAYDLPVEFSNLQALDMSRLGFLQELVEGVENILKTYKKKEAPKAEPAPTYAPAPEPTKKKKKSKAPIIVVAILLALAIAGVAVFASGVLDPFLGGSQTEETSGKETERPTEKPTDKPTEEPTESETEGLPKEPSDLSYVSVHETMYVDNGEESFFFVVDGVQHYLEHGVEVLRTGVSFDGEWSKIEYDGMKGYVPSRYLSYDKLVTETESGEDTWSDEPTGDNVTEPTEEPTNDPILEQPTEEPGTDLTEDGLAYTVSEDGLVYISGIGSFTGDTLVIPAEINGKKVYGIADRAFRGVRSLKSVVISDGIEKIGNNAFAECTLIESLVIGNSISEIGEYAFDQLVSIGAIEIPDSVVTIGAYAFRNCCSAKTVKIGEGVVTIGDHAFEQCNSFTELVIPDSVESIGESAFYDCTVLNSVTLGRGLKTVGASAFDGVADVKKVNYRGSAADWEKIDIAENNVYLTDEGIEHNYDYAGETEAPTDAPTEEPTDKPTEAPTDAPTEKPTEKPTEAPTDKPTEAPTDEPTEAPTDEPTEAPTDVPDCDGNHNFVSNGESGHYCDKCGDPSRENMYDHTYDYVDGAYQCTDCFYEPACKGDHPYLSNENYHWTESCDVCGAATGEMISHINRRTENLTPNCYEYVCIDCEYVWYTKELSDGVRSFITPSDIVGGANNYYMIGQRTMKLESGMPYASFVGKGSIAQIIWHRANEDMIWSQFADENQQGKLDIGQATYLVVRARMKNADQPFSIALSTTGKNSPTNIATEQKYAVRKGATILVADIGEEYRTDYGYTQFDIPVVVSEQNEWVTYVIDLMKVCPEQMVLDEITGSYIVDTMFLHFQSFATGNEVDIAHMAFIEGDLSDVSANVDDDIYVYVSASGVGNNIDKSTGMCVGEHDNFKTIVVDGEYKSVCLCGYVVSSYGIGEDAPDKFLGAEDIAAGGTVGSMDKALVYDEDVPFVRINNFDTNDDDWGGFNVIDGDIGVTGQYMVMKFRIGNNGLSQNALDMYTGTVDELEASGQHICIKVSEDNQWHTIVIDLAARINDPDTYFVIDEDGYHVRFLQIRAFAGFQDVAQADDYMDVSYIAFCDDLDDINNIVGSDTYEWSIDKNTNTNQNS